MDSRELARKLEILVKTDRVIVGVKLVYDKKEYDSYEGIELVAPMSYCVAVKCATLGHSIKLTRQTGGCPASNRALGLRACEDTFLTGENGYRLGLFNSQETAACVAGSLPICVDETYGVIVKPLAKFESDPDVILIVSNPREAMRVAQGYTYTYGLTQSLNISGNQAVCVESTVTPLIRKELNISMLCSGTRYKASWKDTEVMCGIPIEKAEGTVNGLIGTINPIEMNDRKKEIEEALSKEGYLDIEIDYEKTYFKKW